ncbi:hypothetical protein MUO79_00185 [Candidatus Bathyarchaeota archaeon]|nr:hypothetical protein [Candidatus Bathyarchaeota archaeon]
MKNMKITLIEKRQDDSWFDLSLRQLRAGEVHFYRVNDLLTGKWLFKVCLDKENNKTIVKALKCPPGRLHSQLEGATMLFQKSINDDLFYDVISLTHADGEGRLRREVLNSIESVPPVIRENFVVKTYEEATGKKLPQKHLVTLSKKDDEKEMITLFLLERAWTLPQEERQQEEKETENRTKEEQEENGTLNLLRLIKKLEKTSITDIHDATLEELGIQRDAVDSLLVDLEAKGKIKRLDDGYVKAVR